MNEFYLFISFNFFDLIIVIKIPYMFARKKFLVKSVILEFDASMLLLLQLKKANFTTTDISTLIEYLTKTFLP